MAFYFTNTGQFDVKLDLTCTYICVACTVLRSGLLLQKTFIVLMAVYSTKWRSPTAVISCCMPNMKQTVAKHNLKVSRAQQRTPPPPCNCIGGLDTCPVEGKCQTKSVVYQATVVRQDTNTSDTYTGLTSRRYKDRLYEHRSDINNEDREGTGLSELVWKLKNAHTPHNISWKIISKCAPFNPTSRSCPLCLREKFFIMFEPEGATLNHRSEFYSTCRHRLKPLLCNT